MSVTPLELILFASSPDWLQRARAAGLSSFIVDWEFRGKEERQLSAGTEVNRETTNDLLRLRDYGATRRFCRLNSYGPWTPEEVDRAVGAGATDLFLPMVREPGEIEATAQQIGGRCRLGILIETREALHNLPDLARQPVAFVYVGLNDLAISRRSESIFDSLVDGTVDRIREVFRDVPFGCAGVTAIDCGSPVPFALILAELARLGCTFSFARRSFRRDMLRRDLRKELERIQSEWQKLSVRSTAEVERDRNRFAAAVRCIGALQDASLMAAD